jgi:hypothetical protein
MTCHAVVTWDPPNTGIRSTHILFFNINFNIILSFVTLFEMWDCSSGVPVSGVAGTSFLQPVVMAKNTCFACCSEEGETPIYIIISGTHGNWFDVVATLTASSPCLGKGSQAHRERENWLTDQHSD